VKIVHVITRMIVGGAQENTLLSADGQAAIPGNEVILITGPETGSEGNLLEGYDGPVRVIIVPSMVRSIRPISDVRSVFDLVRILRRERPDVIHTHSSKAGVVGRLAGRIAKVPLVFHTLHSLVFHDYQPWPVRTSLKWVKRLMVPFTDHYASVADNIRVRAVAARIGAPSKHSTVYSGFRTDDFVAALVPRSEAREKLGLPQDRFIVGVVARLFELKGHDELLTALQRVVSRAPEVLVAFVGSGPLEGHLRARIAAEGLMDNVAFVGRVPPEEVPVAFSAFDVLAHTSLREGLARVLPQAVLAGIPVVCYDLDGSSEVVEDGVNGYLVRALDHEAMANRLIELATDEDLRRSLAGVGRERIAVDFSARTMAERLDRLYRDLLAARAGPGR
jgi:glycosyltransferase involved in cell wall biosynthesis